MSDAPFTHTLEVRWVDIDINWHMRNTAYADGGTETRITYLAQHGFPFQRFQEMEFGPVILREETKYFREVRLGERITYDFLLAGHSEDGSHFELHHDVRREDGTLAAVLRVEGGWMDVVRRKLRKPPADLFEAMQAIPRTDDFRVLRPYVKE